MDPELICHHLNVNPLVAPKKQLPCHPSKKHAEAVCEEVAKLKQARAIKEVFYPEWLANTVVVKKKSGKWRVVVLTQLPLKTILRSADYIGRIAKWGTILGAFDIKYMPCTSVKGQVLADLMAKFTEPEIEE